MDKRRILSTGMMGGGSSDIISPFVVSFSAVTPNIGGNIIISEFTASEIGVSFLITESNIQPLPNAIGWSETAQTEYTTSNGSCTLYPWVKDASDNVSPIYDSPIAVDVYETPSYSNVGGMGDRTSIITASADFQFLNNTPSQYIDGVVTGQTSNYFHNVSNVNKFLKFQFNGSKIITEAKMILSGNSVSGQGVWKWQGSNNGSTWSDIGASFGSGAWNTPYILGDLSGNTTPYTYYRLLGVSGVGGADKYVQEVQFKIGNKLP